MQAGTVDISNLRYLGNEPGLNVYSSSPTVSATLAGVVFDDNADRLLVSGQFATVTLTDVTLTSNESHEILTASGAVDLVVERLTALTNSVFSELNTAVAPVSLSGFGTLSLTDSLVSMNSIDGCFEDAAEYYGIKSAGILITDFVEANVVGVDITDNSALLCAGPYLAGGLLTNGVGTINLSGGALIDNVAEPGDGLYAADGVYILDWDVAQLSIVGTNMSNVGTDVRFGGVKIDSTGLLDLECGDYVCN
jgi:hypothetical protein